MTNPDRIELNKSATLKKLKFLYQELAPGWNSDVGIDYLFGSLMIILGVAEWEYLRYVTGFDTTRIEEPPKLPSEQGLPVHWFAQVDNPKLRRNKPQNQP